jgi:hypothetical protein
VLFRKNARRSSTYLDYIRQVVAPMVFQRLTVAPKGVFGEGKPRGERFATLSDRPKSNLVSR